MAVSAILGLFVAIPQKQIPMIEFGVGILCNATREGALAFLDPAGIPGQVFNAFLRREAVIRHQRAKLEVDPGWAEAHYGLALVFQELSNPGSPHRHWQANLQPAPRGYFVRRAKAEPESLGEAL